MKLIFSLLICINVKHLVYNTLLDLILQDVVSQFGVSLALPELEVVSLSKFVGADMQVTTQID